MYKATLQLSGSTVTIIVLAESKREAVQEVLRAAMIGEVDQGAVMKFCEQNIDRVVVTVD